MISIYKISQLITLIGIIGLLISAGYYLARNKYQRILKSILWELNGCDPDASHDKFRLQRARNIILKEIDE